MNTSHVQSSSVVQAHRVPDDERIHTLPKHFGRNLLTVESAVYDSLRQLAPQYRGGYWHFYELTNGGFYMAPETDPLEIRVDGNGYHGRMSSEAAGITACLFAFSHLSFQIEDQDLVEHFHLLRDFAIQHAEASEIIAAID